jgi:hypothetical protein
VCLFSIIFRQPCLPKELPLFLLGLILSLRLFNDLLKLFLLAATPIPTIIIVINVDNCVRYRVIKERLLELILKDEVLLVDQRN